MTTLKEEKPFAVVGCSARLNDICSFCFAWKAPVSKCTGCRAVSYCNKECQKSDWVNHKKECGFLADHHGQMLPNENVRLVWRILLKSKKDLTQKSFNDRSWDSLEDHIPGMTEETIPFQAMVDYTFNHAQALKTVSREEVAKTFSKVLNHKIHITYSNDGLNVLGIGVYLGLSVHKHSCVPDSQLIFTGTKASLRCFDQKAPYSNELTFSYLGAHAPWTEDRKKCFKEDYFHDCACPICTDDNHIMNRMGSSCYVSCCANGAGILDENSSSLYRCNKCGAKSGITVNEVKRAEAEIKKFFAKTYEPAYRFNLVCIKNLVRASEKVLSIYNHHFINLCDRLISLCSSKGEFQKKKDVQAVTMHLHEVSLKSYGYYLHETDIILTVTKLDYIGMKLLLNEADYSEVNTAIETAVRTFGEQHPATLFYKALFDAYKQFNGNKSRGGARKNG